ncbi:arylsulfatase I [Megalops cyprinoides]|uniref:arylsulfatase I n=1 Tax=Megalops cyprinoides TaxID=118141 RepID=UPI0018647EF6|nr:arylsulfatase I [Megalops cyprinoides]
MSQRQSFCATVAGESGQGFDVDSSVVAVAVFGWREQQGRKRLVPKLAPFLGFISYITVDEGSRIPHLDTAKTQMHAGECGGRSEPPHPSRDGFRRRAARQSPVCCAVRRTAGMWRGAANRKQAGSPRASPSATSQLGAREERAAAERQGSSRRTAVAEVALQEVTHTHARAGERSSPDRQAASGIGGVRLSKENPDGSRIKARDGRQALNSSSSGAPGATPPPHLIFIMVDDQGYNDVGYHGSAIHTPVLDRLAAKGVKLENYYVQPICSPSRSQLMTGRYQIHTGLQHSIIRPRQPLCLPRDSPTLAERLQRAGYSTHMVGKWHLGFSRPRCLPTGRGFHSFLGSLTGSGDHYTFQSCDGAEACGFDLHDGERPAWELSGNYSTLLYTHRVRQILRAHDPQKPLFLYLSLQAAHTPLQAPTRFLERYSSLGNRPRRHYAGMLSCVDDAVGQVVEELRHRGLYRNSVLVYSSDNGGQPLSGGCNWPLRGGKGTYWEGGVRAVGFVHSPLLKRKGVVSRALVHISDWYPTLLALAGVPSRDLGRLDGHDVWEAISEGSPSPRTEILFNIDPTSRRPGEANPRTLRAGFGIWDTAVRACLRAGEWKLLTGNVGDGDWVPPQSLPGGPAGWEGLEKRRDQLGKSVWLFNITADPYERRDLSKARPDVVRVLLARLAEYNQTAVPTRSPPDDPLADPQLHGGVWTPWLGRRERGAGERAKRKGHARTCKVCRLRALFRKVRSRLQRALAHF